MCNPRRVTVTATRELNRAWQREVERTVQLEAEVVGRARVRQSLAESLGAPALTALEMALAAGDEEWQEIDDGYRHEVEGGYAVYAPERRTLEIVAVRSDRVRADGSAGERLEGTVRKAIEAAGEGGYYDDGWGGYTEERARQEAEERADRKLDEVAHGEVEAARRQAEDDAAEALTARAEEQARQKLESGAEERRQQLRAEAATRLEAVGLRCRQAFHRLLARAYRDALLAYARRQGAEVVTHRDDDEILELEFSWQR
jgi:hypothetical protein